MWNRFARIHSVIVCVLLLLSALVVFLPVASADIWKEETDTDFSDGEFWNTEIVGTGAAGRIQLKKDVPNWVNLEPEGPPEAREASASCYSPAIGKMIIFGGYSSGTYHNDTWEYDYSTNTWTEVNTATSPSGREWAGMTYAAYWGVCVLFGGYDGMTFLADTWEYDPASQTWEETTPIIGPPAMWSLKLAYYTSVQKVIMFGQKSGGGMETWAYNPEINYWENRYPSSQPGGRSGFAMAYHGGIDRIVLFGGSYDMTLLDDTWEYYYVLNYWDGPLPVSGPSGRTGQAMTYSSSDDSVVLFGGTTGMTYYDDTWFYEYPGPTWTYVSTIFSPSGRSNHVMEYDSVDDYVLIFGGYDGDTRLNDTWALGMAYTFQGAYTSNTFYCGEGDVDWGYIWWNQTPSQYPFNTTLKIRLASSFVQDPSFWDYVGPNGTSASEDFYWYVGQEIWSGHDNRTYMRYQIIFISFDGRYTPVLDNITITYNPIAVNPVITQTYPVHIQFQVGAYESIFVNFSKPMDTASVTWTITPYVAATPTWSNGDKTLMLTHTDPFEKCNWTTVLIDGTDITGLPLVPGPVANPWSFSIECTKPEITNTDPAHQETGVALDRDIIIDFSEEMNTTSLVYTVDPNPGGWTQAWSNGNTRVTLSHTSPFREWWKIRVEVTQAKSKFNQDLVPGAVPNPWRFETTGYSPYIDTTDPAHNDTEVPLNKAITIIFSEAMDTPTVNVNITPFISLTPSWTGNTQLTLTHTTNFMPCQPYSVTVEGKGLDGNDLVERYGYPPNPFTFMTTCTYPFITETRPSDGETNVDIMEQPQVLFSETMVPSTLDWSINPNPGGVWDVWWDPMERQVVQFNHSVPFTYCTVYEMEIIHAEDVDGNNIVPGPVPNPWNFTTVSEFPCILNTSPYNTQTNVKVSADIWVNFSESIDQSSFSWSISPDNLTWTETWGNDNQTIRLSHVEDFDFNVIYTVVIISARDLDGNDLVPGPAPNPWWFSTEICPGCPYIDNHYPVASQENIPVDANITVNFSEPMSTGTVTWEFIHLSTGQPVGGVVDTWSNGDVMLTLAHDTLIECDWYQVEITGGEDKDGEPLQPNPDPFDPNSANPWQFRTACINPYIVSTHPVDGAVGVPVDQPIIINFSEEMDTGTVAWTIIPDEGLGWTEVWSNGNTTLTLYHTLPFSECTIYEVEVTAGKDVRGLPLVPGPVPNPWTFTTICPNPYITFTDPADGETGVAFDYPITVGFSEPMDEPTVTWTITPDPGNWSEIWNNDSTNLTLYHSNPFAECAGYQVTVTGGLDLDGLPLIPGPDPVPNPWIFTTACIPPYIEKTDPYDSEMEVPLDYDVTIWFSEPMNTGTFLFTYSPDSPPLGWQWFWYDNDTRVVLNHSTNFTVCTWYTIKVMYAEDKVGLVLVPGPVPNPWTFMSECPNPYINSTDPRDGEVDVPLDKPIEIEFSDPMDTASVTWTIKPDGTLGWSRNWYLDDTLLVLTHSVPFQEFRVYTVNVTGGADKDGYPLISGPVPNPWQFRTIDIPPPRVNWTDPYNGEMGVSIWADVIISFTKQIVPGTFHWNFTVGPDPGGWTQVWSQIVEPSDTVTLSHSNSFNEGTSYCIRIEHAKDIYGQDIDPRPVDFCFVTRTGLPPPSLTVTKVPPTIVRLTWNRVPGATHYNIYDSTNKWAPFPSGWNLNQVSDPTTIYDFSHLGDGWNYYYIVRAYDNTSGEESANSTMGVKIEKDFTISALGNIYWMSLPFVSEYQKASDIANELTSSKIDVVGKWNRQKQKTDVYFFARGKWRGTDFTISAGDGIYVGVVSSFSWYIVGTDSDASIDLPFSPVAIKQNRHWVSVPYTGDYARASDIVADIESLPGAPYITEVGKWDPATQTIIRYFTDGSGTNFNVEPGDGIYLKVIKTFNWTPILVTPYVP